MRTVVVNTREECPHQFVIPKEKRDELNKLISNFYEHSKPTYHEFSKHFETLYKSFLDDALQNRPKLSKEKMYIFNKLSEIFWEALPPFVQKEDFTDVLYNILSHTESLQNSKISEEKIHEIHHILKNSLPHSISEYHRTFVRGDTGYEENVELFCQKVLNVL